MKLSLVSQVTQAPSTHRAKKRERLNLLVSSKQELQTQVGTVLGESRNSPARKNRLINPFDN